MKNSETFTSYRPEDIEFGHEFLINMQVLVKIKTPIKLNVIKEASSGSGLESNAMIDEKDDDTVDEQEVHFVQFENVVQSYKFDSTVLKQLF